MCNKDSKLKAAIFSPKHNENKWQNYSETESDDTKNLAKLKRNCMFMMIIIIHRVITINYKNFVNHIMSHIKVISNDVRPG